MTQYGGRPAAEPEGHRVRFEKRPTDSLGIRFEKRDVDGRPPRVEEVFPGSLAARAGIRPGDRIEAINGLTQVNALKTAKALRETNGKLDIILSPRTQAAGEAMRSGAAARPVALGRASAGNAGHSTSQERLLLRKNEGDKIGLRFAEQIQGDSMLVVDQVLPGSLAERAGLRKGDTIETINGAASRDPVLAAQALRNATGDIELGLTPRAHGSAQAIAARRIEEEKAAMLAAAAAGRAGAGRAGAAAGAAPSQGERARRAGSGCAPGYVPMGSSAPSQEASAYDARPAPQPAVSVVRPAEPESFFGGLVRRLSFSAPTGPGAKPDADMAAALAQVASEQAAASKARAAAPERRERRPSMLEALFDFGKERRAEERRQRLATLVQAAARGFLARLEYARARHAVLAVQAGARGKAARKEARYVRNAASRCQAGWRGRQAREEAKKRRAKLHNGRGHKHAGGGGAHHAYAKGGRPAASAGGGGHGADAKPKGGGLVRRLSWRRDHADTRAAAGADAATPRAGADAETPRGNGLVRRLSFGRRRD